MEDHRRVSAGKVFVPNRFRVFLAPATLAGFATFEQGLEDELASFLGRRAEEAGFSLVGRLKVTLLADPELKGDRVRVSSDLVDRRGVVLADREATSSMPAGPASPEGPGPMGLWVGARLLPLPDRDEVSLGRALDNDIVLEDPSVSRHHARLVRRGGSWMAQDLASRHGCFVNGRRVQAAVLRDGDSLQLGGLVMRLVARDGEVQPAGGAPAAPPRPGAA
jgi:hypothetical protein